MSTATHELTGVETPDFYPSRQLPHPHTLDRLDPVVYGPAQGGHGLSGAQLLAFDRDGYLFFPELFPRDEIQGYAGELRRLAAQGGTGPETILEPSSGDVRSIFQVHRNHVLFRDLSRDRRLTRIAFGLLDSDVYIHQSRVNLKPGFVGKEFYWHSDFETWHVEDGMPRMRAVSCSINLTDNHATNGPVMVIPGSHRQFVACVGQTPENHYQKSLRRQEYGVPDQAILTRLAAERGIEAPVGPAGSVLFFDCNLLHGSNSNITPFPRSNIFFVYNSTLNRLAEPFGNIAPRPEFVATRESVDPILRNG